MKTDLKMSLFAFKAADRGSKVVRVRASSHKHQKE